jgi:amino acid transporter
VVGTEGERTVHRGGHAGDRAVRIVRPRLPGLRTTAPGYVLVEHEPEAKGDFARSWRRFKRTLIGKPISSAQEIHERLTKVKGLAVFAADNISSSAYATEEIMRVLVLAGAGALALTMPLTIGIVVLLAIVATSYQQTIRAYPNGGGSYIVASDNLGVVPGLIAGAALLIDYVLTVAVSISAGIAAVTSAFPLVAPERVLLCVVAIALLTLGNLRGIRESGTLFAAPLYLYLVSILGLLAFGLFRWATGTLPDYVPPTGEFHGAGQALTLFLVLRAFSSGSVALTGVEAVSNGIPAFKPPESHNARITLIWMASLFAVVFLGISFLATHVGIVPDPAEVETVLSQLTRTLVGTGWYYYLVQFSTTVLLILAANTSFADFPRLASLMARDKFLPGQFAFRGERLAFNNGIVVLAAVAAFLVVVFGGSVTNLIPLYTVGVFVAFTLSQTGMVVHHWRLREPGWHHAIIINAVGAVATAVVAVVVGVTKFALGAWMVLVLIPILVVILLSIRRHYHIARDQLVVTDEDLRTRPDLDPYQLEHVVVIPVADLNRPAVRAAAYARSLTGEAIRSRGASGDPEGEAKDAPTAHIVAVHVTDDAAAGERLKERWDRAGLGIDLVILRSPYRALAGPLLAYIDALERQQPEVTSIVTVLLPEYIPAHWWEHVLHTQTALMLKGALLFRPRTAVLSVPYHLED